MSEYATLCDAIIDDLRNNVNGLVELKDANVHRYNPWSPEELTADGGKHLAVWPAPEAETVTPLATGSHWLVTRVVILYWESSGTEGARLVSDETGAADLYDLLDAVKGRIYRDAFQTIGGFAKVWHQAVGLPEQVSRVRGFEITLTCERPVAFSTS